MRVVAQEPSEYSATRKKRVTVTNATRRVNKRNTEDQLLNLAKRSHWKWFQESHGDESETRAGMRELERRKWQQALPGIHAIKQSQEIKVNQEEDMEFRECFYFSFLKYMTHIIAHLYAMGMIYQKEGGS